MNDVQLPKRFGLKVHKHKDVLPAHRMAKLQNDLKPMQNLSNFVDLSKPLEDLNALQHRKVRSIIEHLKYQAYTKKILEKNQDNRRNLQLISQQLEVELDTLNNLDAQEKDKQKLIDLIRLQFGPKEVAKMIQESSAVVETYQNLHTIKEQIKSNKSSSFRNQDLILEKLNIQLLKESNSDQQDFYRSILDQTQKVQLPQKNATENMSLQDKFQMLKDYLKQRGIEFQKQEAIPHQSYLQFFTDKSNQLIKQTRDSQLSKLKKCSSFNRNFTSAESPLSPNQRQPGDGLTGLHTHRVSKIQIPSNSNSITKLPRASVFSKHIQSPAELYRDFAAKTQAIHGYFTQENQEYTKTIAELDYCLKKPWRKHFKKLKLIETEHDELMQEKNLERPKIVKRRKLNLQKLLRQQKIFKQGLYY